MIEEAILIGKHRPPTLQTMPFFSRQRRQHPLTPEQEEFIRLCLERKPAPGPTPTHVVAPDYTTAPFTPLDVSIFAQLCSSAATYMTAQFGMGYYGPNRDIPLYREAHLMALDPVAAMIRDGLEQKRPLEVIAKHVATYISIFHEHFEETARHCNVALSIHGIKQNRPADVATFQSAMRAIAAMPPEKLLPLELPLPTAEISGTEQVEQLKVAKVSDFPALLATQPTKRSR